VEDDIHNSDSLRFSVIDKIVISPTRHTGVRVEARASLFWFFQLGTLGVGVVTSDEDYKGVSQKTPFAVPEL
tara:strand:+ start:115 stop:330 length:216 start_codon:yes stop_codon:yes gene_type:complete